MGEESVQQYKWICTGYVNAGELCEAGGRGPLESGRQSRSIRHIAESQVGHARQKMMGRWYSEKQIWNQQETGCGICEVGMRNQKQHKAEDDRNRRNVFPTALVLALAHRLPFRCREYIRFRTQHRTCSSSPSADLWTTLRCAL